MPIQTPSRTVRSLSAGAALAAASLASAGGPAPLVLSTVNAATAIINLGSTTGTLSLTGPSSFTIAPIPISAGSGNGMFAAVNYGTSLTPGYTLDYFASGITTTNSYTAGVWTMTLDLTVNRSVIFSDLSFLGSAISLASWTVDSVAVADGDVIAAGNHIFTGTFIYAGPSTAGIGSGFGLLSPAAGGVPLPGAAGLAAIGLAGMARRRRR